jgi:hypothetical protein
VNIGHLPLFQVFNLSYDLAGAFRRFDADRRPHHATVCAVYQRRCERGFEFLDAGAERRLGHMTRFKGTAEMTVIAKRD